MFKSEVYAKRRTRLHQLMKSGLALFIGNVDVPMNYPANTYHFRQDSDFLYFFGLDIQGFTGLIDFDSGKDWIFGNDVNLDDIIWMGPQPKVRELAQKCGVTNTAPLSKLEEVIKEAVSKKRKIHFLPPYPPVPEFCQSITAMSTPHSVGARAPHPRRITSHRRSNLT